MPPTPLPAAARLAALNAPLGSAPRNATQRAGTPPSPAARTVSSSTAPGSGFQDLLASQLSQLGQTGQTGQLSQLGQMGQEGQLGQLGLGDMRDPLASLMNSPTLARSASVAQSPSRASAPTTKAQKALAWAKSMVGRQDWNNLCERFVEEAYGTKGVYPSAKEAARELVTHRGRSSLSSAPPGALLYFAADETNEGYGHAAINLGGGKMVSARPDGVQIESVDSAYNSTRYLGWGQPPSRFPGRGAKPTPSTPARTALPASAAMSAAAARSSAALPSVGTAKPLNGAITPPRLPGLPALPALGTRR